MAISQDLLKATEGRAPGALTYGAAGLKKTNAIATLPYPVLMYDIGEGGTASITPWVRRRRRSYETQWTEYTDADRQTAFDLLNDEVKATVPLKPAPYVDVISYDNMTVEAWDDLTRDIGNFDFGYYNSLATDSLQEFSVSAQTFSRKKGNEMLTMNEVPFAWVQAQERAAQRLRMFRNFRDRGVFIYMTGSEDISKDYVKNPMQRGNQDAEPYSIRGTVNLPGKLAEGIAHLPDLLFHAKLINMQVKWVSQPEALPGGGAWWDGKDRYGRLDKYCEPNFRRIFDQLYGEEGRKAIYASGRR